jgi:hypothetical protein
MGAARAWGCVQTSWGAWREPGWVRAQAPSLEGIIAASASACGFGYSLAPAAGLYVAVRGIGRAAARGHVHIADSVAMPKPVQ